MSVRSFHSVFMATAVAGAALGCYLVSLRVASERAALEQVERQIVQAQRDIRLLQTEIGTRGRLAQLERWNVRVLALSAPTADQILGDKFQLARLVRPERNMIDAPVILAAAPASEPQQPLGNGLRSSGTPLLHEASLILPPREDGRTERADAPAATPPAPVKAEVARAAAEKAPAATKKAGEKNAKTATGEVTPRLRTASVDPLAPLPAGTSTAGGSRTQR